MDDRGLMHPQVMVTAGYRVLIEQPKTLIELDGLDFPIRQAGMHKEISVDDYIYLCNMLLERKKQLSKGGAK